MERAGEGEERENRKACPLGAARGGQGPWGLRKQVQTMVSTAVLGARNEGCHGGWIELGSRRASWKRWHTNQAPGEGA